MIRHAALAGGLLILSGISSAESQDPLLQLIDILKENGTLSEQQHTLLVGAVQQRLQAAVAPPDDRDVVVRSRGNLEAATINGEFSARIGSTLMIDVAGYQEDRNDLGSGTELRRAKIGLSGTAFGDWAYEFDVDFADNDVDIDDAFLRYDGGAPWSFTFGQQKQPFGLEYLTGSTKVTFMERALPAELVPGRAVGASAHWYSPQFTMAAGVFAEGADSDPDDENSEGWGVVGRVTYAPFATDRRALHLGASGSFRETDGEDEIRFRTEAETHITGIRHLDTGRIRDADSSTGYGLEFAWVEGPFSVQSEWIGVEVDRSTRKALAFDGWYAQLSWMLTGGSRAYEQRRGAFGRVQPVNSHGAVELAGRISQLDLNDLDISGGRQRNIAFGLNWYINASLRLSANYVLVDSDINADADGDVNGDDDFDVMQMRMQYDF